MQTALTLYEQLGGQEAIQKVVERFYEKILSDDTINHFFKETDMKKQIRHQTLFLTWVTGGPNQYTGQSMSKAHEGLNLQEEHFNAVAGHLVSTLQEFGVTEQQIGLVVEKLLTMKEDVLRK
ncbi:group I truncated hemoglobin [Effusibacillus consociatus]|uniref:Group 1 truncated hemoglobin n=1 Tax=Effusibacillus consociatus TaxID=1117041 RepID=A0ABV9PXZ5_9BACL